MGAFARHTILWTIPEYDIEVVVLRLLKRIDYVSLLVSFSWEYGLTKTLNRSFYEPVKDGG